MKKVILMEEIKMPYVDDFLKYIQIYDNASEYTIRNYKVDLKQFFKFTNGRYKVNGTTIRNFTEYLLYDKKEARTTINRRLSCLSKFLKYLYNEKKIDILPKINFLRVEKKPIKKVISQEKVFKILESIENIRDRAILEMLYFTGM